MPEAFRAAVVADVRGLFDAFSVFSAFSALSGTSAFYALDAHMPETSFHFH